MRMVKVSWRFFFYNNYLLHFLLIEGCSFIDCLQSAFILNNKIIIIISLKIQSPLPKTDTFGTGTKCPSYRESSKDSKERQGPALGVCFIEVSVS